MTQPGAHKLTDPLELPCGLVLKNRLAKSAMSDALSDGTGRPTDQQVELYRRWAEGGAALSLIGEVQVDHRYPENPGNLVLGTDPDLGGLARLAEAGTSNGSHIWPQLGHAGALAYKPLSRPAGPSRLSLDGLNCDELSVAEIEALPDTYARAALVSQSSGFSGVQIHAGHGFLLSQFLSPLFNHRSDDYGGSAPAHSRLLIEIVARVRQHAGPEFAIGVKINSSDGLEGGLGSSDALDVVAALGGAGVDLIEISGGTYFPGAPSSSDRSTDGPYFVDFARRARSVTDAPVMVTGGFKIQSQAVEAVATGATDVVGLARTMALDPHVASKWLLPDSVDPVFPCFESPAEGAITAWFTMRLAALGDRTENEFGLSLTDAVRAYAARDRVRTKTWQQSFPNA